MYKRRKSLKTWRKLGVNCWFYDAWKVAQAMADKPKVKQKRSIKTGFADLKLNTKHKTVKII